MMGAVLLPLGGVVFGVCLAGLAYADIRWGLLPDRLVALLAATAVIPWLGGQGSGMEALGGSGCGACLLWLLRWLSRGGLGWGDVKLAGAAGLWLGWQSMLVALGMAFLTGGLWACVLVWQGRQGWSDTLPFGPFLAGGFLFAYEVGAECWQWYWSLW